MRTNRDGSGQFESVTLRPQVTVAEAAAPDVAEELHRGGQQGLFHRPQRELPGVARADGCGGGQPTEQLARRRRHRRAAGTLPGTRTPSRRSVSGLMPALRSRPSPRRRSSARVSRRVSIQGRSRSPGCPGSIVAAGREALVAWRQPQRQRVRAGPVVRTVRRQPALGGDNHLGVGVGELAGFLQIGGKGHRLTDGVQRPVVPFPAAARIQAARSRTSMIWVASAGMSGTRTGSLSRANRAGQYP